MKSHLISWWLHVQILQIVIYNSYKRRNLLKIINRYTILMNKKWNQKNCFPTCHRKFTLMFINKASCVPWHETNSSLFYLSYNSIIFCYLVGSFLSRLYSSHTNQWILNTPWCMTLIYTYTNRKLHVQFRSFVTI